MPKSRPATARPAIRAAIAGLLLAAAMVAGCSPASSGTATAASSASNQAVSSASNPAVSPAVSSATTPAQLRLPAAPTDLNQWAVPFVDGTGASEEFSWTAPGGTIAGYYFATAGTYTTGTPPPATCGPGWQILQASAVTFELASVDTDPEAYICAFNDAGTSPTVVFKMQLGSPSGSPAS